MPEPSPALKELKIMTSSPPMEGRGFLQKEEDYFSCLLHLRPLKGGVFAGAKIKAEIRRLKDENKLTNSRIRSLENKLEDEAALIREQNLEFKDEILGEIKAMREELMVTLG